jgi:hypothetical protein
MMRIQFILGWLLVLVMTACNLNQASSPAPLDLPSVRFVEPANNARVLAGTDLTVDLYAQDSIGVERMVFYVDGVEMNTVEAEDLPNQQQARVYMNWVADGLGLHILSAVAYRADGVQSDETYITVEVVAE